jgi:hypothetical protein
MSDSLKGFSQGQRLHYLANLGGLMLIAGLSQMEPDLLLGALSEIAIKIPKLPESRIAELKQLGSNKLSDSGGKQKSFDSWARVKNAERFDFTLAEMQKLIPKLGGKLPAFEKDIGAEFRRVVREVCGG